MTRVLLLRHGETDWNATGRLQGSSDVPLNDRGRAQADAAARAIAPGLAAGTRIVSSPLLRARATADALGAVAGIDVEEDERLVERTYGEWEGLTSAERRTLSADEVDRWHAGFEPRIAGYESHARLLARLLPALREIAAAGEDVVAVGHGSTWRLAVRAFLGLPEDGPNIRALGNAAWAEFEVHGDEDWRLARYNVTA